jgi:nucleoside-diphosphate-sugar epimerase
MKVLVTGSAGFIAGYVVQELLNLGYEVIGVDNCSKYGRVKKSYQNHPGYQFIEGDVKDDGLLTDCAIVCDHFIACAARIGGITDFHKYGYDLLVDNERILTATFDAAIASHQRRRLQKITVVSSSLVDDSAAEFPTPQGLQRQRRPPSGVFRLPKLACALLCQGAWEQHQLPYTICRPFHCVGLGERWALSDMDIPSGNLNMAMSHVLPDLVQKVVKGQDPLHLLGSQTHGRCYTYGGDVAKGVVACMEHSAAWNQDFDLAAPATTTEPQLAELIWQKVHGSQKPLRFVSDPAMVYDAQTSVPDTRKAKELLGFEASTTLDTVLEEVIAWVKKQMALRRI